MLLKLYSIRSRISDRSTPQVPLVAWARAVGGLYMRLFTDTSRTRYGYKRSTRPHNSTNSHAPRAARPSDKSVPRYSKGTVSSAVCALRAGAPSLTLARPRTQEPSQQSEFAVVNSMWDLMEA